MMDSTPTRRPGLAGLRSRLRAVAGGLVLLATCGVIAGWATRPAWAQSSQLPTPVRTPAAAVVAEGPAWRELTASQKQALRPLERDWASIDGARKRKWIEIAQRFPSMSRDERARLQERMRDWARLSPQDRNTARLNFRDAKDLPIEERRDRWQAYQNLSEADRRRLAEQAAKARRTTDPRAAQASPVKPVPAKPSVAQARDGQKSNIVPNPSFAARPKVVAPTTLQARPGATTTPITKLPTPPWHQQPGLPKIATTPEFVDTNTLLPVVGPQGAGTTPPARNQRSK